MIELINVTKNYSIKTGVHSVFNEVNCLIKPGEKVGVLGRNGAGKSTLIRILSGAERPTSGIINRSMSISWPLAFGGAFQGSLSGLDNLKFICRIYGVDFRQKVNFIESFSELGAYFREPVRLYSSGMRARLAFAISMAVEFDCFLIDEIIAVGDSRFHEKCQIELFEKRKDRAYVMVSHDFNNIKMLCKKFYVLCHGKLFPFESADEAYSFYLGESFA